MGRLESLNRGVHLGVAVVALLLVAAPAAARFRLHRGDVAPPIAVVDTEGRAVAIGGSATSILLFVRDGQTRSDHLLTAVAARKEAMHGVRRVVVASPRGPVPTLPAGLSAVVVHDSAGATFKAYGVVMTPTTVVVDGGGKVVAVIAGVGQDFGGRLGAALDAAAGRPFDEALLTGGERPAAAAARGHLERARLRVADGKSKEALVEAKAAVDAAPGEVAARLLVGDLQLATGDGAAARATFEQILGDHPRQPQAEIGLGRALLATGEDKRAVALLKKATRTNPNPVRAHYALGRYYETQSRWDDAVAEYRAAITKLKEGRR